MANEMLVTCRICGKEYTGRLDGLFYDGEDGNGPPVPLGASCPSCEPASPTAESECVCGGTTSRPNDDCERCQLLARIREMEGIAERMTGQIRHDRVCAEAVECNCGATLALTEYAAYRQKHGGK